jgi:MFS family permease
VKGHLWQSSQLKWPTALRALRHRNFRIFWCGQLISLIGTWMQNTAQGWLVLELTDSPFLLGLVSAIQWTPSLLLSLVAGVVADRFPRRTLIIITQSCMMVLALILGFLTYTDTVRYWHVLILAGILGTANTFDMPARQSFVIKMVGKDDLPNAIALNSSVFNAARIIGPAVAGLIIAQVSIAACFIINGLSYVAVLAGLLSLRVKESIIPYQNDPMILAKIKEGLQYIWRTSSIRYPMALLGLLSLSAMNFMVLIPVLARETLNQQALGYGYLMTSVGLGAFAGSVTLALISGRKPRRRILLGGALGLCLFQLFLVPNRSFWLAAVFLVLTGFCMVIFTASVNTTIQLNVADELRGRVMSVYSLVFVGVTPLGSLFSGSIADVWGAPASIAIGAGLGLAGLAAIFVLHNRSKVIQESHSNAQS